MLIECIPSTFDIQYIFTVQFRSNIIVFKTVRCQTNQTEIKVKKMKSQTRRNVCYHFSLTADDEWISWNRAKLTSISKLRGRNVNRRWLITSKFNVLLSRQLTKKRSTVWAKSVILVAEKLKCVLMMNNSKFNHNLMHLAVGTWLIVMAQVGISHSPGRILSVNSKIYELCTPSSGAPLIYASRWKFVFLLC